MNAATDNAVDAAPAQLATPSGDETDRLRAILDSSLDPLIFWRAVRDVNGVLAYLVCEECNAAAVTYLRSTREAVLGVRLRDLFSAEAADRAFGWAQQVIASGQPLALKAEPLTTAITQDVRQFDVSIVRVGDGVSFAWRDVTKEYRSARALHDSEESLRVAMKIAPVAMNLVAPDGSFIQVNPAMCEFLGRDEQVLLEATWQSLTHPDDLAADLALVQEVLDGRRNSYRLTKRFVRPDGQVVWGDLSVAAVRDDRGAVKSLIAQIMDVTELVTGREELADSREHYRMLAEHTSDVVLQTSVTGVLEWVSPSVADTFGWNRDEVLGRRIDEFVAPGDWQPVSEAMDSSTADGMEVAGEFRVRRRGGRWIWVDATSSSVRDRRGHVVRVVRLRDVDAEVRARIALKNSEERFRTAMRATPIGVALISRDGHIVQVNAALSRMVQRSERSLTGKSITSLTHPDDRAIDIEMLNQLHSETVRSLTREKRIVNATGESVWVQNALAAVQDEQGEISSFVAQFLDVSETQQAHAALEHLAHLDPLTDIKNRRAVLEQMHAVLSHPPRTGTRLGVLYCDLDRFKRVNDLHGHAVGDALLVEVARRIQGSVREGDTVGRIGGDEFLVLLTQIHAEDTAVALAEKIRQAVSRPFTAEGVTLTPSMSMGAALAEDGDDPDAVVARADRALYEAKERGRDQVVAFSQVDPDIG